MNKPVVQEDGLGCGVACVAFILSTSYKEALELFDKEKVKSRTYCVDIQRALEKGGKKYFYRKLMSKSGNIYEQGAIIFIKRSQKYPFGHFLARGNGRWVDPWINLAAGSNIKNAQAGFRKRLPGKPTYGIFPTRTKTSKTQALIVRPLRSSTKTEPVKGDAPNRGGCQN